jgi:hypothetical protein
MMVMEGNGEAAGELVTICGVIAKIAEWQYPIARGIRIEESACARYLPLGQRTLGTDNHQGEVWML